MRMDLVRDAFERVIPVRYSGSNSFSQNMRELLENPTSTTRA